METDERLLSSNIPMSVRNPETGELGIYEHFVFSTATDHIKRGWVIWLLCRSVDRGHFKPQP